MNILSPIKATRPKEILKSILNTMFLIILGNGIIFYFFSKNFKITSEFKILFFIPTTVFALISLACLLRYKSIGKFIFLYSGISLTLFSLKSLLLSLYELYCLLSNSMFMKFLIVYIVIYIFVIVLNFINYNEMIEKAIRGEIVNNSKNEPSFFGGLSASLKLIFVILSLLLSKNILSGNLANLAYSFITFLAAISYVVGVHNFVLYAKHKKIVKILKENYSIYEENDNPSNDFQSTSLYVENQSYEDLMKNNS